MKQTDIFDLLPANAPFPEYADKLMLFGQFVGAWDIDAVWYSRDKGSRSGKGEWHFGWILGGRGIQDVLFSVGAPPDHFGTTLRCYDPTIDAWHVTWMQPYGGEFVHLIGRKVDDRIVLESIHPNSSTRLRWSFSEITPTSFLWRGEVSTDGGEAWFLEQEMRAARKKDAP